MNTRNGVTLRTTTAPTVLANGMRVTPESRVLTVRLPFGGFVWNRPSAVMVERDGRVERLPIVGVTRVIPGCAVGVRSGGLAGVSSPAPITKGACDMIETRNGVSSAAEQASVQSEKMSERLYAAAQPGAVFAPPVVAGAYTIITASEVAAGGGFGFGAGSGPTQIGQPASMPTSELVTAGGGGGGGGGGSRGRPVAAIIISTDGVKVQPIVDATKIALAAIAAWISVGLMAMRLARTKKR